MTLPVRPQLFQQSITNQIGVTAATAPMIGYLDANKTRLEVQSTLTQQDPVDMFKFSFRKGDSLKIATNNNKGVRVQLLDSSGGRVLADNGGTNSAVKKAFADIVQNGIKLKPATYILKVSHDVGVARSKTLNYDITFSAGTTFKTKYKTLASANTIQNQLATGFGGYSTSTAMASSLTSTVAAAASSSSAYDGTAPGIFDTQIQSTAGGTNIFNVSV